MNSNDLTSLLIPTALGAVGGGALSAHLAHKSDRRNEDPAEKRKRVLRNALGGAAMGAGVGAILPGAKLLTEGYSGAKPGLISGAADKGLGLVTNNLAGLGVAGAGAYGVVRNQRNAADQARKSLAELLYQHVGDKGSAGESARLSKLLEESASGEALNRSIFNHLSQHADKLQSAGQVSNAEAVANQAFTVNDLLRTSGHKGVNLRSLLAQLTGQTAPEQAGEVEKLMGSSLQKYLGKEGPISKRVGGAIGSMGENGFNLASRLPGPERLTKHLPSPLAFAEKYHEHINPAAWRTLRRIPTLAAVLGIAPAALLANRLQKQVTGQ